MPRYLDELRNRKLVQWGLAYLAGAWLLLQLAALLADIFDLPRDLLRALTVVLVVGFFVALVLAWFHGERGRQRVGGVELLILALLLLTAGFTIALARGGGGGDGAESVAHADAAPEIDRSLLSLSRLTADEGLETMPAWARDGRAVAYVSNQHGNADIHVHDLATGTETHVAEGDAEDTQPAWSPDGRRIAFVSSREHGPRLDNSVQFGYSLGGGIWLVPALGGTATRVIDGGYNPTWSPDGRALAYDASIDGARRIWRIDVDTRETLRISTDASGGRVHTRPAWSPDGRWIAFQQHEGSNVSMSAIAIVPASGGGASIVVQPQGRNLSPEWLGDSAIVFSSDRGGVLNLWMVRIDPRDGSPLGEPTRLTAGTTAEIEPAIAPGGDTIAFSAVVTIDNLWRVSLDDRGALAGEPVQITRHTWNDLAPSVAAPAGRIAVSSDRDGTMDIWTISAEGADARRIAAGTGNALQPVWSPDARTIAFFDDSDGDSDIYVVPANGGTVVRLTDDAGQDINPYWSPDGGSIAFMSDRTGQPEIWVMGADGTRPHRLTSIGATEHTARWSPDGRWILFTSSSSGDREIWAVAAAGGVPRRLTSVPSQDGHGLWSSDGRFVYYLADHAVIWRVPFDTETGTAGTPTKVWEPGHRIDYLHLAPDGRTLYFTVPRSEGDVWLLRGLRGAIGRAAQPR